MKALLFGILSGLIVYLLVKLGLFEKYTLPIILSLLGIFVILFALVFISEK